MPRRLALELPAVSMADFPVVRVEAECDCDVCGCRMPVGWNAAKSNGLTVCCASCAALTAVPTDQLQSKIDSLRAESESLHDEASELESEADALEEQVRDLTAKVAAIKRSKLARSASVASGLLGGGR